MPSLSRYAIASLVAVIGMAACSAPTLGCEMCNLQVDVVGTVNSSYLPTGPVSGNLGSFDIVINPNSSLSSNTAALAAFNRAAAKWEARISDPITVTINAGLASLGTGIIGSTSAVGL